MKTALALTHLGFSTVPNNLTVMEVDCSAADSKTAAMLQKSKVMSSSHFIMALLSSLMQLPLLFHSSVVWPLHFSHAHSLILRLILLHTHTLSLPSLLLCGSRLSGFLLKWVKTHIFFCLLMIPFWLCVRGDNRWVLCQAQRTMNNIYLIHSIYPTC